jgi:hypothetical protein
MDRAMTWHIEIFLSEEGVRTRAVAVLRTGARTELRHEGVASRNPNDTDVLKSVRNWQVHAHLVVSHHLFEATVSDIEQNVHQRVQ